MGQVTESIQQNPWGWAIGVAIGAVILWLVWSSIRDPGTGGYDPFGPDRDCSDFSSQRQAQNFYKAAGGPASDRHRLDADRDGIACEALR